MRPLALATTALLVRPALVTVDKGCLHMHERMRTTTRVSDRSGELGSRAGDGAPGSLAAGGRRGAAVGILVPDSVAEMLGRSSPVALGISGGKDSCALALAASEHLDAVGHSGARILIHADLGSVEWSDSLPTCERLAERLGIELVVVRRAAGGMMQRWQQRWRNNVERYRTLSCMRLILPWSTASMRFCTSELKVAVITSELRRRFGGSAILSATGIRRDESSARAKAVVLKPQARLVRSSDGTSGFDWNPLLDWSKADVLDFLADRDFTLHEAYRTFGSSRVSCAFCILGSKSDLRASALCESNHAIYREMVSLEVESAFAFQPRSWLSDVAPELLDDATRIRVGQSKEIQRQRESIEQRIPRHLLYTAGWPAAVPTESEAEIIAEVRSEVAALYGWSIDFTEPSAVIARHERLLALKESKSRVSKPPSLESVQPLLFGVSA